MKAIYKIALFTLLVAGIAGCEILGEGSEPEQAPALRYFPLAVGHVWEYEQFGQTGDDFCPTEWTLSGYLRYEIRDEVTVRGRRYFELAGTRYDLGGVPFDAYVLTIGYETKAARVVLVRPDGTEQTWFASPCELDTAFGEFADCGSGGFDPFVASGSETWTGVIGGDSLAGAFKRFDRPLYSAWYSYVRDVGLISSGQFDCGGSRDELIYANVGGREIGTSKIPQRSLRGQTGIRNPGA